MPHYFDPGYHRRPFTTLCRNYPDDTVYPPSAFRTEWGPIFHRGRLNRKARVLVIGQDPAAHESIVRRVLVGEAGQRVQGFLHKLGITRSYVLVNVFLYSVYGQHGGNRHKDDPGIVTYRNLWLDALLEGTAVEAVIALGGLAEDAWNKWRTTPAGQRYTGVFVRITHPTFPESSGRDRATRRANTAKMLENWNAGLATVYPALSRRDIPQDLELYGTAFAPTDLKEIPDFDYPPGLPPWMRGLAAWSSRSGLTATAKRATIKVTVPKPFLPAN
jgi:uracil-DNA glycosylase